jgi:hypothetical protein
VQQKVKIEGLQLVVVETEERVADQRHKYKEEEDKIYALDHF